MTRGYVWGYYESDDGHTYAWRVDADYFADPVRGWTGPAVPGTFVYPRFWSPRRVVGHDADGNRQVAIVASTGADLWSGAATTFDVNGTDGLTHTCTVDFSQAERANMRP